MCDELKKQKAGKNEGMVINIADSSCDGSHCICLFIKDNASYYFDSCGIAPIKKVIKYCTCED